METRSRNTIPEDEIDVRAIGNRIFSFFNYCWSLLTKNMFVTLVFVLAAVGLSYSLKQFLPKVYRSSFVIRPNDAKEKFHLKIFKDITDLLKTEDYATMAQELNISEDVAKRITNIRIDHPTVRATPDSVNYTEIVIETVDYNQLIPLQNSLLYYLEHNPYFLKMHTLQMEQVEQSLKQVRADLPQLDSLKKLQLANYGKQEISQGQVLLSSLMNPATIYTTAIERLTREQYLQAQQVFGDNFQLVKGCVVVKRPISPPRVLVMCLVFVPVFLILCLLFLHLKTLRQQR